MTVSPLEERLEKELDPAHRLDLIDATLRPPEPHLLDTCVVQNIDWVDRQLESAGSITWDDAAVVDLGRKYGADLANDLIDLGILYKEFESLGGYPWLVCNAADKEAARLRGRKGQRLGELIRFFRGHQEDWSCDAYPGITQGLLFNSWSTRVSPLLLRGLGVSSIEEVYAAGGPLSFLPDRGDRVVVAQALIANVPVVLTTDRQTFWKYRGSLNHMGLRVMRPSELLQLYLPYWEAIDAEFARRRRETS